MLITLKRFLPGPVDEWPTFLHAPSCLFECSPWVEQLHGPHHYIQRCFLVLNFLQQHVNERLEGWGETGLCSRCDCVCVFILATLLERGRHAAYILLTGPRTEGAEGTVVLSKRKLKQDVPDSNVLRIGTGGSSETNNDIKEAFNRLRFSDWWPKILCVKTILAQLNSRNQSVYTSYDFPTADNQKKKSFVFRGFGLTWFDRVLPLISVGQSGLCFLTWLHT